MKNKHSKPMTAHLFLDAPKIQIEQPQRFDPYAHIPTKEFHFKLFVVLLSDVADTMQTLAEKRYFKGNEEMKHFQKVAEMARNELKSIFGKEYNLGDYQLANSPFNRIANAHLSDYEKKLDPYLEEILSCIFKMDYIGAFHANMHKRTSYCPERLMKESPFETYQKTMKNIFTKIHSKGANHSFDWKKVHKHTAKIIFMSPDEFALYSTGKEIKELQNPNIKKVKPCLNLQSQDGLMKRMVQAINYNPNNQQNPPKEKPKKTKI